MRFLSSPRNYIHISFIRDAFIGVQVLLCCFMFLLSHQSYGLETETSVSDFICSVSETDFYFMSNLVTMVVVHVHALHVGGYNWGKPE